jgi:hypothetical protein
VLAYLQQQGVPVEMRDGRICGVAEVAKRAGALELEAPATP